VTEQSEHPKRWWKKLWEFLFPPEERPPPPPPRHGKPNDDQSHYSVQNADGDEVSQSDSLAEAHRQWQQLTNQTGKIIDTTNGEDVTPLPDDNGRYVVLDKSGNQLESFGDKQAALESWRERTNESGSVIDTKTGEDITAKLKGFLTKDEMDEVLSCLGSGLGRAEQRMLSIDPYLIRRLIEELNHLPIPVFNITNIKGNHDEMPKKTVEIKRREVTIEKVKKIVTVEGPGPKTVAGRQEVPYPTDEQEPRRIRRIGDLTRVPASRLAMPRAMLDRRLARRELPMPVYEEEVPGEQTVRKRKVYQEVEEPKVREWTEKVEISDEPRAQLLEIVLDVSGSMDGYPMNLAIALVALLVGKHLDDGSRYFYRQFGSDIGKLHEALTSSGKRRFVKFLVEQKQEEVGWGTNILGAITLAARDVLGAAEGEDQPEVLLVTDGDQAFGAESVYQALGSDVILHTVLVGLRENASLRKHSSTYYEISYDGVSVRGGERILPKNVDYDDC